MPDILYAARGQSSSSQLYTLNPSTGAETAIGDIGYAVTGLAFDPADGILYGVTTQQSPGTTRALITIDTSTGTGTLVAQMAKGMGDIAFDRAGNLWGDQTTTTWRGLYSINKSTAAITQITTSLPAGNSGGGMDFMRSSPYTLYALDISEEDYIYTYDVITGDRSSTGINLSGAIYPGDGATISAASFSPSGIFYGVVSNYGTGCHLVTIDLSTGVITDIAALGFNNFDALAWYPPTTYVQTVWCVDAIDDPNTGSSTVTVLGDAVRETQTTGGDGSPTSEGDATSAFYVRGANLPPAGTYTVDVKFRRSTGSPTQDEYWTIFLKRNGLVLGPIWDAAGERHATSTETTEPLTSSPETGYQYGPIKVPVISGDVYEICALAEEQSNTLPIRGIEILQVCFTVVDFGGGSGSAIYPLEMAEPQTPVGGSSYSSVYDGTYEYPYSKDMLVMPDGTIYILVTGDYVGAGAGLGYYVHFIKWNGSTWSTIEGDVWGHGDGASDARASWNASLCTDGTDIYLAWGEQTNVVGGAYANTDWVWRCKKYNVGAGTFTELGSSSGQSYYSHVPAVDSPWGTETTANSWNDGGRATLYMSPAEVLWIAWVEERPDQLTDRTSFTGGAANLDGGTDGFNSIDGSNPATRDGSGNAVGGGSGESGSWYVPTIDDIISAVGERIVFEIGTPPAAGTDFIGVNYRVANEGGASYDCCRVIVEDTDIKFQKVVSGVVTTIHTYSLTTNLGISCGAGDRIGVWAFYSNPAVYYWDASAGSPLWQYLGSWTGDTTFTTPTAKQGICFSGTSATMTLLREADWETGQRPCVSKWNGSSWDDMDFPFYPGAGPYPFDRRHSDGYQYVGVVNFSAGEQQLQLTFCNVNGPSEYPSALYVTEHDIPMRGTGNEPYEIQHHYCEWDGADWVNWIMFGGFEVWGTSMYEDSNVAPNYFANNSFNQGFSFFHDGERPCFAANMLTHSGAPDLVGFAKLKSDGSLFESGVGNPDDVIRNDPRTLYYGGAWLDIIGCETVIDSRGQIFQWGGRTGPEYQGHLLMRNAAGVDIGTGSDWMYGARTNNRLLWYAFYEAFDRLGIDADDNVYLITDEDLLASGGSYVYKWTPGSAWYPLGLAGDLNLSRIRYRAYQDNGL